MSPQVCGWVFRVCQFHRDALCCRHGWADRTEGEREGEGKEAAAFGHREQPLWPADLRAGPGSPYQHEQTGQQPWPCPHQRARQQNQQRRDPRGDAKLLRQEELQLPAAAERLQHPAGLLQPAGLSVQVPAAIQGSPGWHCFCPARHAVGGLDHQKHVSHPVVATRERFRDPVLTTPKMSWPQKQVVLCPSWTSRST